VLLTCRYWGKRDEELLLPVNSSLSATLHQEDLKTTTSIVADSAFEADRIFLNGKYANLFSFLVFLITLTFSCMLPYFMLYLTSLFFIDAFR
jgi:hypothetical protein